MANIIMVQIGETHHAVAAASLPPIGTRISVDGDLTGDRIPVDVEVIGHEWRLTPYSGDPAEPKKFSELDVWVQTRPIK